MNLIGLLGAYLILLSLALICDHMSDIGAVVLANGSVHVVDQRGQVGHLGPIVKASEADDFVF